MPVHSAPQMEAFGKVENIMAITRITYTVTRTLFEQQMLPRGASVLEFGLAWHRMR